MSVCRVGGAAAWGHGFTSLLKGPPVLEVRPLTTLARQTERPAVPHREVSGR